MNRREFLQCAAVLIAGSASLPKTWAMNHEQHGFLAANKSYITDKPLSFFSNEQRAAVKRIAQLIIPTTSTPGAVEAGADRFIELMIADWFTVAERNFFMTGLNNLLKSTDGFIQLTKQKQLTVLEQLEDNAADSGWFEFGDTMRVWDDDAPFICQLKELTVLGYFLSELGAQQALRVNPMGSFNGDIPLLDKDTAYAAGLPMRQAPGGL